MENQEICYIEESQSWTCPIAGRWKIIAVGGGASGGGGTTATSAGGTTSFGAVIFAPGGMSTKDTVGSKSTGVSGYGGYTGFSYGGIASVLSSSLEGAAGGGNATLPASPLSQSEATAALGWGAGGGACSTDANGGAASIPGRAGEIRTTIIAIEAGENIACTIGKGGTAPTVDKMSIASGADGVIVLQYLGV